MTYIPIPDSFIHPRSNQPAKGHSGRMAEIKFFHIFKHLRDDEVRWATKQENIYKKYDVVSSHKQYGKMDVKAEKDAQEVESPDLKATYFLIVAKSMVSVQTTLQFLLRELAGEGFESDPQALFRRTVLTLAHADYEKKLYPNQLMEQKMKL